MRVLTALLSASLPLLADGRAHLLPAGEFAARDGRPGPGRKWRLDDVAGQKIAAAMNAVIAATPIVIDYEHQTLHKEKNGQPAPAAGWMREVTWLTGKGLVSQVDWTPRARTAIDGREYQYLSPVITWDDDSGAITGVHMAALTNYPALLGMDAVAALTSQLNPDQRAQEAEMTLLASLLIALGLPAETTEATALTAVTTLKTTAEAAKTAPQKTQLSTALTAALGVPAEADEAAALAAVAALKTPNAAAAGAIQALQTQVAALTAQVNGDKVTTAVDDAIKAGKLVPALRDWALSYGKSDFAALTTFIEKAPVLPLNGQTAGATPPGGGGTQTTALAAHVMGQFGLSQEQFDKGKPKEAATA